MPESGGGTPAAQDSKSLSFGSRFLLATAGIFFLWLNVNQLRKHYLLYHAGSTAQGQVTRIYTTSSTKGGPQYRVQYWFTLPGGEPHLGKGEVSVRSFRILKSGDPIGIRYVPAHPDISEPAEVHNDVTRMAMQAVFIPFDLCLILIAFRRKLRKENPRLN